MHAILDPQKALLPAESRPLQLVNFVASQTRHRCEEENFELLSRQFSEDFRRQLFKIYETMIPHGLPWFELDALKGLENGSPSEPTKRNRFVEKRDFSLFAEGN
jgi:hypothetical protein